MWRYIKLTVKREAAKPPQLVKIHFVKAVLIHCPFKTRCGLVLAQSHCVYKPGICAGLFFVLNGLVKGAYDGYISFCQNVDRQSGRYATQRIKKTLREFMGIMRFPLFLRFCLHYPKLYDIL